MLFIALLVLYFAVRRGRYKMIVSTSLTAKYNTRRAINSIL
jgi:hypothetical protein